MSGVVQRYYILSPEIPVPEHTRVLKHGESFALFNEFGDIDTAARHEEGLYHEGTRFLSRLQLLLADGRPHLLSSSVRRDNLLMSVDLTNPDLYLGGELVVPRGSLHIYRAKLLHEHVLHERLYVRNFTREPLEVSLGIAFGADFRDVFEIRGQERPRRGRMLESRTSDSTVELGYHGLDEVTRRMLIECRPAPARVDASQLDLQLRLGPRGEAVYELTAACESRRTPARAVTFDAALNAAEQALEQDTRLRCTVTTSNDQCDAWLQRAAADLNMLLTRTPHGDYPYAGVPWFDTPFGRDGIITALQCLWLAPPIARGVLGYLAATQATGFDEARDAEPGKILHEARHGEMAATGEIPFGRYYGSVDSTPLFVMLAGAYYRRTGDLAFLESLWLHVTRALAWIDGHGDPDQDGFVEYHRRSPDGLVQQGWKDSNDSVFHADGRLADGPIALCEVQAYVHAARLAAADVAVALGREADARTLQEAARSLRERFQRRFWCEDLGLYALALDGEKEPCRVRSSNAGHTLLGGIAAPEHARAIERCLGEDTFFSGWGVRTIADSEVRYNPMAYHNGSIWPHDNALIAAGAGQSPSKDLAVRILQAQLEASTFFESNRLPELFCGFRRRAGKAPTNYPVACSPQAWACGAPFMLLEACLGLTVDAVRSRVTLCRPALPPGIERVRIGELAVGRSLIDLTVQRQAGGIGLNVTRRRGDVEVVLL